MWTENSSLLLLPLSIDSHGLMFTLKRVPGKLLYDCKPGYDTMN